MENFNQMATFIAAISDVPEDKDATIAFMRSEINRLQSRVSELGALIGEQESWQNRWHHNAKWSAEWEAKANSPKSVPKGRT